MKVIGLIGGMSWESTQTYYRLLNTLVRERLGGLHSARLILYSLDFEEIAALQRMADWDSAGRILADAGRRLEAAGAECLVICTNTMHKVAAAVEAAVAIPVLNVIDAVAFDVKAAGARSTGLLGTRFTMEQAFYRDRLAEAHGLTVMIPPPADCDAVHRIIFEELVLGRLIDASRLQFRRIISDLVARGAGSVILGCTEISLLVGPGDAAVPLFDTTAIHARAAVEWALGGH